MRRTLILLVAVAAVVAGLAGCTPRPLHAFVVTSGADGVDAAPGDGVCEITAGAGDCTLRAAAVEANALAASAPEPVLVTVTLDVDVTLALAGADEDLAATGDLDLDVGASELRLDGAGHQVDAAGLDRAFDVLAGTVQFDRVVVTGGRSVGPGGALRTAEGAAVGVVRSTFVDNRALVHGACFAAAILGRTCVVGGPGEPGGTNPIGGGAIANGGNLVVLGSTFEANGADSDVALPCRFGSPQWAICPATWGGAIQSTGALFVSVSTFVGNDAVVPLGGTPNFADPFGTAIHATGTSQVVFSTVLEASSQPVGAVVVTTVQNSIVVSPSCGDPVIDADRNLRSPEPCGTPAPTGLGVLGDHGGPTRTVLPEATSPAIDAIAWEDCLGTTIDQRGEPRSEGQPCDIGAVERLPTDP